MTNCFFDGFLIHFKGVVGFFFSRDYNSFLFSRIKFDKPSFSPHVTFAKSEFNYAAGTKVPLTIKYKLVSSANSLICECMSSTILLT